jgi:2-polyprenyl-3-methyl-5-hydroxy-6-metoxy-1,4-benzoquinol methylase
MEFTSPTSACRVCGSAQLEELASYRHLPRVTSDCLPFRDGGRLLLCSGCGAAQSPGDAQWFQEIAEIYRAYDVYHQSGGVEQLVRDAATGQLRRRSDVLADRLAAMDGVPNNGKLVDIGCGTGVTLKVFSERGGWQLHGLDQDRRNLPFLEKLPGFVGLYTCAPSELPDCFDLITMVHSLEHFPEPASVLRDLRSQVAPGGRLFVQVPNAQANPFEYLVADHMIHFSARTLAVIAARAGFATEHSSASLSIDWIAKELSLVTQPASKISPGIDPIAATCAVIGQGQQVRGQIEWLWQLVREAESASRQVGSRRFGLFGSSIAATWLAGVLGDRVSFFVEEDANRIGREHLGRRILGVDQVPAGALVYIALVPVIAAKVGARLRHAGMELCLPPPEPLPLTTMHKDPLHDTRTLHSF